MHFSNTVDSDLGTAHNITRRGGAVVLAAIFVDVQRSINSPVAPESLDRGVAKKTLQNVRCKIYV